MSGTLGIFIELLWTSNILISGELLSVWSYYFVIFCQMSMIVYLTHVRIMGFVRMESTLTLVHVKQVLLELIVKQVSLILRLVLSKLGEKSTRAF